MSSSDEETDCPLCLNEFDEQDRLFRPCPCNYKICIWCWHTIRNEENSLCPACRAPYSDDLSEVVLSASKSKRSNKSKHDKNSRGIDVHAKPQTSKADASSHHSRDNAPQSGPLTGFQLASRAQKSYKALGRIDNAIREDLSLIRVLQRNLVYIVGLTASTAREDVLNRNDFFGQFGPIIKVAVNKKPSHGHGYSASYSAYVTFKNAADARAAILYYNGKIVDGRTYRATYGTTKYCSHFLNKSQPCPNTSCLYLHALTDPNDSFTKEELAQSDRFSVEFLDPSSAAASAQSGASQGRAAGTAQSAKASQSSVPPSQQSTTTTAAAAAAAPKNAWALPPKPILFPLGVDAVASPSSSGDATLNDTAPQEPIVVTAKNIVVPLTLASHTAAHTPTVVAPAAVAALPTSSTSQSSRSTPHDASSSTTSETPSSQPPSKQQVSTSHGTADTGGVTVLTTTTVTDKPSKAGSKPSTTSTQKYANLGILTSKTEIVEKSSTSKQSSSTHSANTSNTETAAQPQQTPLGYAAVVANASADTGAGQQKTTLHTLNSLKASPVASPPTIVACDKNIITLKQQQQQQAAASKTQKTNLTPLAPVIRPTAIVPTVSKTAIPSSQSQHSTRAQTGSAATAGSQSRAANTAKDAKDTGKDTSTKAASVIEPKSISAVPVSAVKEPVKAEIVSPANENGDKSTTFASPESISQPQMEAGEAQHATGSFPAADSTTDVAAPPTQVTATETQFLNQFDSIFTPTSQQEHPHSTSSTTIPPPSGILPSPSSILPPPGLVATSSMPLSTLSGDMHHLSLQGGSQSQTHLYPHLSNFTTPVPGYYPNHQHFPHFSGHFHQPGALSSIPQGFSTQSGNNTQGTLLHNDVAGATWPKPPLSTQGNPWKTESFDISGTYPPYSTGFNDQLYPSSSLNPYPHPHPLSNTLSRPAASVASGSDQHGSGNHTQSNIVATTSLSNQPLDVSTTHPNQTLPNNATASQSSVPFSNASHHQQVFPYLQQQQQQQVTSEVPFYHHMPNQELLQTHSDAFLTDPWLTFQKPSNNSQDGNSLLQQLPIDSTSSQDTNQSERKSNPQAASRAYETGSMGSFTRPPTYPHTTTISRSSSTKTDSTPAIAAHTGPGQSSVHASASQSPSTLHKRPTASPSGVPMSQSYQQQQQQQQQYQQQGHHPMGYYQSLSTAGHMGQPSQTSAHAMNTGVNPHGVHGFHGHMYMSMPPMHQMTPHHGPATMATYHHQFPGHMPPHQFLSRPHYPHPMMSVPHMAMYHQQQPHQHSPLHYAQQQQQTGQYAPHAHPVPMDASQNRLSHPGASPSTGGHSYPSQPPSQQGSHTPSHHANSAYTDTYAPRSASSSKPEPQY